MRLDVAIANPTSGPARDEMGDEVVTYGEPTTWKGWFEQDQRGEDTANTDQQVERWRLYLVPAAAGQVSGSARATVQGDTYELIGPPWAATHPRTGQVTHVEATMRLTT